MNIVSEKYLTLIYFYKNATKINLYGMSFPTKPSRTDSFPTDFSCYDEKSEIKNNLDTFRNSKNPMNPASLSKSVTVLGH